MDDVDAQRLMIKVARLYHTHGMRQTDIARRLQISQSRVSRLLTQAEESQIVRTVVAVPRHINAELEEVIEEKYGLAEVHVVDVVGCEDGELTRDLALATAAHLHDVATDAPTIGFTSWSRTLRLMVDNLQPLRTHTARVVETVGDLGPPGLQHEAARSTQRLAALTGGEPVFLRTPGVVATPDLKRMVLSHDSYAIDALRLLDEVDLLLIGVGTSLADPDLRPGDHFFTDDQLARVRAAGAVAEICLHFLDAEGNVIDHAIEDVVVGITTDQLAKARRRWTVAGGERKHAAVRAALCGGWVDTLVTDTTTAEYLAEAPGPVAST